MIDSIQRVCDVSAVKLQDVPPKFRESPNQEGIVSTAPVLGQMATHAWGRAPQSAYRARRGG